MPNPAKKSAAPRSVFRAFMTALKAHWRSELPPAKLIDEALDPLLPKASTFSLGFSPTLELHVFANFQQSRKAWKVGQFTVNVILSKTIGAPKVWGRPGPPPAGQPYTEGSCRIGHFLSNPKDKWWHLKSEKAGIGTHEWRPTSYRSVKNVLTEAVLDVTHDVRAAMAKLGVPEGRDAGA